MKTPHDNRRAERRRLAKGDIRLYRIGIVPFIGRLLDLSPNGFRTRHSCLTLGSGDRVDFEFAGGSGSAQAMWTRIVEREAETGFRILR
jgi:hypothetical protein